MTEFITHTIKTAPEASKSLLQRTKKELGFMPNLYAAIAESPPSLEAYRALTLLFKKTDFTDIERQLILFSISRYRNCCYCLAAHSTIATMQRSQHKSLQMFITTNHSWMTN
jgi:AhpD family alkylhydroperoxidase